MRYIVVVLLALVATLVPRDALAWGASGHRVVCEIAWLELTASERERVVAVLDTSSGDPHKRFVEGCVWADSVRGKVGWTDDDDRHFLNARGDGRHLAAPSNHDLDPAADCGKRCATEGITLYRRVLVDGLVVPHRSKLDALRFLSHFVGDVHQPLHAGYGGDVGGNSIPVLFHGRACFDELARGCTWKARYKLHSAWDTLMPEDRIAELDLSWGGYAAYLQREVTPAQRAAWVATPLDRWAAESFAAARATAYPLGADREVAGSYYERAVPVFEDRLKRAGVRLASLLKALP
jgi:hypothetical protein